jgi:hypothetical protein
MTDRQRRDLGEIRLEILERAGYVWRATPLEGFWHATRRDLIHYPEALDATFAQLAQRIAEATP